MMSGCVAGVKLNGPLVFSFGRLPIPGSDSAELLLVRYSDLQSIRSAIEELPPIFQEVLLLCDVEEMSYKEIAHALSIPIGTVMSRLARARRAIRVALRKTSGAIPCGSA